MLIKSKETNPVIHFYLPDIKEILKFFPKAEAECVFVKDRGSIYRITYEPN